VDDSEIENFENLLTLTTQHFHNSPGSLCAVEISLYDAYTKNLKIPLVDYWGREIESLPTSVTIGIMPAEEMLEKAKQFISNGFRVLKIKLGSHLEEDVEMLVKLREQLGNQVVIRVDANQGYSLLETKQFFNKTTSLNVELVEQPVGNEDFSSLTELSEADRKLIAADESLVNSDNAQELVNNKTCGIFNIKLMKTGGLSEAQRVVRIAEENEIDLMWGCNDESIISIAAALHIAYASRRTKYIDLDGSLDLSNDIVIGGFELRDGFMHINDLPGLGVNRV